MGRSAISVGEKALGATKQHEHIGLLTIHTDEGVDGHAFLGVTSNRSAEMDALSLITYLKPVVMGQDPLARERLHETMIFLQNNTTIRAIGAVDVALWDIGGKVAGLPLYQMLGSYRESIPAYVSSPRLATPEDYAAEAAEMKAVGWAAYKIHPPAEDIFEDIEVLPSRAR